MSGTAHLVSEYVEFWYNLKRYLVKRSDIDNKEQILMLPDGTAFVGQIRIETTDKHGNPLGVQRLTLFGNDPFYETYGFVPPMRIVKAIPAEPNKPKLELFQVKLFYHPSGDHMDPRADHVEEFFTLSTTPNEAAYKVVNKLEAQRLHYPPSYKKDAIWKVPPIDTTPEQALSVLKTIGLSVIE